MAKVGLISDRTAGAYDKLLQERPCTFGCGGKMTLAIMHPRKRTVWSCQKCFKDIPKVKNDWTPARPAPKE
jgi:hypothetical protein